MLRLVNVTPQDVDVLFELVCMTESQDKQDLMQGLRQMAEYFVETRDPNARLVLPAHLYSQLREIVTTPWMPADAERWGLPQENYMNMVKRLPAIRQAFDTQEMIAIEFVTTPLPLPKKQLYKH